MILKQVIRYTNADALEATWVEVITLPQQEISPGVVDLALRTQEVVVKCQAYANSQMDMLAADLGADAPQYQALMDEVAATYVPPAPTPRPESNAAIWEDIKAIRDRKTQQGGYKVGTDWYHSDTFSRSQQLGLVRKADKVEAAGGDMNTPFPGDGPGGFLFWKTMIGSFVPMTPTLAQAIFSAAEAQDGAMFLYAEQLKAQVEAAQDPTTVDIKAGWPTTYGDV